MEDKQVYIIVLPDGSYAHASGLKNNIFNAFRFKTLKEANSFARKKYIDYIIKEI